MKFPKPKIEVTAPIALEELDDRLGTQTQQAYRAAVEAAPRIAGLAVILDDGNNRFEPSPLGLGGSSVKLNPDPEWYREALRSGKVRESLGKFSALYRSRGITPGINELIVAIELHELGHAVDFAGYISRAAGDTKAAFELSAHVRTSQLAGLPLKMSTSSAEYAMANNTNGYRDRMQKLGYVGPAWTSIVTDNLQAYRELPCEKVADRFALGVLATVSA